MLPWFDRRASCTREKLIIEEICTALEKTIFRVLEWICFSHLEIQYCGFKPSDNSYRQSASYPFLDVAVSQSNKSVVNVTFTKRHDLMSKYS